MEIQRDPIYERLFRIYTDANRELLLQVQSIVAPHAEALAEHFYSHLLAIEEARQFLDHQMVSERLHRSMAKWIQALFLPCDEASVEEHIKWQQKVGDVHARINVPMKLVNHGMRLLKSEMGRLLEDVDEALYQAKNQGKNTFYIKQAG